MNLFGAIGNAFNGALQTVGLEKRPVQAPQQNRPINLGPGSMNLQGGGQQQFQRPAPMIQIPHLNLNTMQVHQIPTKVQIPSAVKNINQAAGLNQEMNHQPLSMGRPATPAQFAGGVAQAILKPISLGGGLQAPPKDIKNSTPQQRAQFAKSTFSAIAGNQPENGATDVLKSAAKIAKDYPSFLKDAAGIEKLGGPKFKSEAQAQNFFLKHNPTGSLTSGGAPLLSQPYTQEQLAQAAKTRMQQATAKSLSKETTSPGIIQSIKNKLGSQSGSSTIGTVTGADAAKAAAGKVRGFTTTMKNSPNLSEDTKGILSSSYTPRSDSVIAANTNRFLKQSNDKATALVLKTLAANKGSLTDQMVHTAGSLMYKLDQSGDSKGAQAVHDLLAEGRTTTGQSLRGGGFFSIQSPQALLYTANKTLKDAKVTPSKELSGKISSLVDEVSQHPIGSDGRSVATQKLIQTVNQAIPRSIPRKALEMWRTGLISGPETLAKVGVSQPFNVAAHYAAQIPGAAADVAQSAIRAAMGKGFRRGTALTGQGIVSGAKRGVAAIPTKLRTNIDLPNTGGFEPAFGKNAGQSRVENAIFSAHGSVSKPGFASVYDNTIAQQAKTAALNQGLKGADRQAFIDKFTAAPPKNIKDIATKTAQEATNQQRTSAGTAAGFIQRQLGGAGTVIAPITRVPSAIGTNALYNYSGLKLGVDAAKALKTVAKGGQYTQEAQRIISQDIGRTAVGAGGLGALGYALTKSGNMTLQAPTDPKEKAAWQTQGKQANSVKIGGTWISLNALGPVGIEMAMGAGASKGPVGAGLAGLKTLADQPYLKGISAFGQAISNPVQSANSYVNSLAGSLIPGAVQQTARGTDSKQRVYPSTITDTLKGGIPGLREQLPAQHDLFGNTLPGAAAQNGGGIMGGILGTINPFLPSAQRNANDQPTQEIQRLYSTLGSQGAPPIGQPKKGETINGVKVKGSDAQLQQMVAQAGPNIHAGIQQAVQNPTYGSLNDTEKSGVIKGIIDNARSNAKLSTSGNAAQKAALSQGSGAINNNSLYYQNNGKLATLNLAPKTSSQRNSTVKNLYQALQDGSVTKSDYSSALNKLKVNPQDAMTTWAKSLPAEDRGSFVMDQLSSGSNASGLAKAGILTTSIASDLYTSGKINQQQYAKLYAAAAQTSKDLKAAREAGGYSSGSGKKYATISGKSPGKIPTISLSKIKAPAKPRSVKVPSGGIRLSSRRTTGATPKAKQVVLA